MNDIYTKLRPLLDKYNLFERLGDEDYGSLYVDLEALIADEVREAVKEEKSIRAKLITKAHKDGIADGLQMALYGVKNGSKEEKFIRHLLYSENIGDKE